MLKFQNKKAISSTKIGLVAVAEGLLMLEVLDCRKLSNSLNSKVNNQNNIDTEEELTS